MDQNLLFSPIPTHYASRNLLKKTEEQNRILKLFGFENCISYNPQSSFPAYLDILLQPNNFLPVCSHANLQHFNFFNPLTP